MSVGLKFTRLAATLVLQQRVRNSVRKEFSRVSAFCMCVGKPALKLARQQQSSNQPLTRVIATKQPYLFGQRRLERMPANTPLVFAKDQQIQTAHQALVRLLAWPFCARPAATEQYRLLYRQNRDTGCRAQSLSAPALRFHLRPISVCGSRYRCHRQNTNTSCSPVPDAVLLPFPPYPCWRTNTALWMPQS